MSTSQLSILLIMIGFVHTAKTAGTSIKFILANSSGLGHCNIRTLRGDGMCTDRDVRFASRVYMGLRSISGHTLMHPSLRLQTPIDYFTFLRDPIDRCASHYQQYARHRLVHGRDSDIEEYLSQEKNCNRQVRKVAGVSDVALAKSAIDRSYFFVGLVEEFRESVSILGRLSPVPLDLRYYRMNVTVKRADRDAWLRDDGIRRLMSEANGLDLELYAHVRDELYPAYRRDAGLDTHPGDAQELDRRPACPRFLLNHYYTRVVYRPLVKLFGDQTPAIAPANERRQH